MKRRIKAILVSKQSLTAREAQIAELLCEGLSDKAIANKLAMKLCTVQRHLEHVYEKLECQQHELNTRVNALRTMLSRGMVRFLSDEA